jgi:hypothetical protein
MLKTVLDGLSLIDATGMAILGTTGLTLILAIALTIWLRGRYAAMNRELSVARDENTVAEPVLRNTFSEARTASAAGEANLQAIIEDRFQSDLSGMLLAERFVRAATGLVIILGLLGTFYGLTLSIGRIVHLVSADNVAAADIAKGVSDGLSKALSGMAVAFSNSLVGVLAAVILSIIGALANVSDQRTAVMVRLESVLSRAFPKASGTNVATSPEGVARLESTVVRFEQALANFAASSRDFREFNSHLRDNIARLSLTFSEMSETVKVQVSSLRGPHIPPRG